MKVGCFASLHRGNGWSFQSRYRRRGAANYPTKPIRLVVPWPPGGGTDVFARVIGQKLAAEHVGYNVVIDNRPGAAGNIGAEMVAKSPPDGYTIMLATITLATNPSMYKALNFDPIKDFAPITLVAGVPHVLVVSPSLPVNSVKDLIALAKAEPGKLNYASAGNGSPFHLAAELFKLLTGTTIVHVPYQGGGPAITAVIGGQVQLTFGNLLAVLPLVKSGKLKALGVTGATRSSAAPDLPTIAEEGVRGYDFQLVVRIFRASGNTQGNSCKAKSGNRAHSEYSRDEAATDTRWGRRGREHFARVQRIFTRRNEEMGPSH